jgi:hypothetical protein
MPDCTHPRESLTKLPWSKFAAHDANGIAVTGVLLGGTDHRKDSAAVGY